MDFGASELAERLPNGLSATLIVGRNGAGKSRLLADLARYYKQSYRDVIAVSNTSYDRFMGMRGLKRISAASGRSLPVKLIKEAISFASSDSATRLDSIASTLEYCDYDSGISVTVIGGPHLLEIRSFGTSLPMRGQGLRRYFDERQRFTGGPLIDLSSVTTEDLQGIQLAVDLLLAENGRIHRKLDFSRVDLETSKNRDLAQVVRLEWLLKRLGLVSHIDIEIARQEERLPLHSASSGELSLISTLVFLATSLPERAILLIDEPENSLHPQWQKEYVNRLLDLLYYRQPTIVIATHAPLIVSGAQLVQNAAIGIFEAVRGKAREVKGRAAVGTGESISVEETLWETFGTVTPKSHYVSESLATELDKIASGDLSAAAVISTIDAMARGSFDPKQKEFFSSVKELAQKISDDPSLVEPTDGV